ncbi:MAG: YdcF family protein [Candidatus Buchananbacteria bacterium]|nr:YdcF family protein [Candidatus Buchananbacteria bacterium]
MDFDGLITFSGGLKQSKDGSWRTTNFNEAGDKSGVLGDRLRILAAAHLAKIYPQATVFVLGGRGYQTINPQAPKISDVMERELVELGVAKNRIIKDGESGSSYEQLRYVNSLVKNQRLKKIGLISNRYHLPRLKTMIEHLADLSDLQNAALEFLSAEDVLIEKNPDRWKKEIDEAYQTPAVKKRIQLEEQGITDLKSGQYRLK